MTVGIVTMGKEFVTIVPRVEVMVTRIRICRRDDS